MKKHVAVDLGASNARVIVGDLTHFDVVHRFVTPNEQIVGALYWDLLSLFSEIKTGLKRAFAQYGDLIGSIGIDAWGVDHLLLDETGSPVSFCYHYRDKRTDDMIEEVTGKLGGKMRVFEKTGIAFNSFNTLYQLAAMQKMRPDALSAARHYLSIPDLLAYWLTGIMENERTHVSTTQLYDPKAQDWAWDLIDEMGFDKALFGKIVDSGTIIGPLTAKVCHEVGAPSSVLVIATSTHDTASAVAAVPVSKGEIPLYISSGTWSLLGVEIENPIITAFAMESGFTNEVSANRNFRFLKSIMGMWIPQQCVRHWESLGEDIVWKVLDKQTLACSSYEGYIDPEDPRFLKPNSYDNLMVDRIQAWCIEHGQAPPSSRGEYMVATYRGLAKTYALSVRQLQEITGLRFTSLHIIGGGCKNEILNQWTATETGLTVHAGPVEATALGNILVQMYANGELASLEEGRDIIKSMQKVKVFHP